MTKILDNEPKEMRPMTEESNEPKKRAEYLVTIQLLNDIKTIRVPGKELYNIISVFLGDDNITGLMIYKTNYKTTTVKID